MTKTIAIVGVTGYQGGSVADKFLSLGWNVRGITRSRTSDAAKAQAAKGISIVEADLDTPSSLVPAFSGAHVVFVVTDFWASFWENNERLARISDRATGEHAYAIEVQRGKNAVDAIQKVVKDGGVLERFILSTLPNFTEQSRGKYTYAYHFDSKAEITEYLKSKEELWERSSLLNMAFYSSNIKRIWELTRPAGDGTFKVRKPGSIDAIHPWVIPEDTGIFADLLVRSPPKQDLLAVSEMASYKTLMATWSKISGITGEALEISIEEADAAAPGGFGRESGESTATSAEFGWGDHLVLPTQLDPNIKTTSMQEYMEKQSW